MVEASILLLAFTCSVAGMGLLALAMKQHSQQARPSTPYPSAKARTLRLCGSTALGLSLVLCLLVEHPSIAPLLWVMAVTISALLVAFTLAYRPHWLAWLVAWLR